MRPGRRRQPSGAIGSATHGHGFSTSEKGARSMKVSLFEAVGALGVSGLIGLLADDSLVGIAVLVLLVGMKLVHTDDRLFVLPAAYAFHWLQTSLGLFYLRFAGREVPAVYLSDYR